MEVLPPSLHLSLGLNCLFSFKTLGCRPGCDSLTFVFIVSFHFKYTTPAYIVIRIRHTSLPPSPPIPIPKHPIVTAPKSQETLVVRWASTSGGVGCEVALGHLQGGQTLNRTGPCSPIPPISHTEGKGGITLTAHPGLYRVCLTMAGTSSPHYCPG